MAKTFTDREIARQAARRSWQLKYGRWLVPRCAELAAKAGTITAEQRQELAALFGITVADVSGKHSSEHRKSPRTG